jgi:predicted nucleotidyltransferase
MDICKRCRDILLECENIVFAYIFGSFAQGNAGADSDIDVAIYLAAEIEIETYLDLKVRLAEGCKREVDLVILNEANPFLRYEIQRNNILLFSRDKTLETHYKVKTLFEYSDVKKYLDLHYSKTIKRLKEEVRSHS